MERLLMAGGMLLLLISALLFGYNLWLDHRSQVSSSEALSQFSQSIPQHSEPESDTPEETPAAPAVTETPEPTIPPYVLDPDMEMPTLTINGRDYIGRVDIPSLGLSLPVISQWSDANLNVAPCRYTGSAYQNNLVLAGHNYKSQFGPLKDIQVGDTVLFTDADGNVFSYTVARTERVEPTDIDGMVDSPWALTLFTCTTNGKARYTIRCQAAE
jgi:sortase A